MKFKLDRGSCVEHVTLAPGRYSVGGGPNDHVRVEGLKPALLVVDVRGDRATVRCSECLLIGPTFCPPRVNRLWMEDEVVELDRVLTLSQARDGAVKRCAVATVAVLRSLFEDVHPAGDHLPALVCLTGLDMGRRLVLTNGDNDLGRGASVALRIRDRAASRRHATIRRDAGATWIRDLGGPNGIFVNGKRTRDAVRLKDGDILEMGYSLFRYSEPAGDTSTPRPRHPEAITEPLLTTAPQKKSLLAPLFQSDWMLLVVGVSLAMLGVLASVGSLAH